ncbi:hypothetical protein [Aestuariivivens sediminicola]|uniref:hypothetical protein n=1 Tax=Aestuariivivens sediminicola TaxID=2913560 RepID=UPI001F596C35|nr:hypothetical protein [Aestuariivivens sediminicola]
MTKITYLCFAFLLFTAVIGYANTTNGNTTFNSADPQLLRIDFTMPNGYVRHLAIGFTPDNVATDGYDYGYDALNVDDFPDDLNWLIENERYVIQGVGAFDDTKNYPLGLFLTNSGNIKISFDKLENFENPIDVFVYDAYLETYTRINDLDYASYMSNGDYTDRFYIAFKDNSENGIAKNSLSAPEAFLENTRIQYLSNSKEVYVNTRGPNSIKKITIYNLNGQQVYTLNNLQNQDFRITIPNLKQTYGIVSVESDTGFVASKQIVIN